MKKLGRKASEIFRTMGLEKYPDGWYITKVPPYFIDDVRFVDYGPYRSKNDAVSDMAGVAHTLSELED